VGLAEVLQELQQLGSYAGAGQVAETRAVGGYGADAAVEVEKGKTWKH